MAEQEKWYEPRKFPAKIGDEVVLFNFIANRWVIVPFDGIGVNKYGVPHAFFGDHIVSNVFTTKEFSDVVVTDGMPEHMIFLSDLSRFDIMEVTIPYKIKD